MQQAHADGKYVLLSLAGAGSANAGASQAFIAPFDVIEPASRTVCPRRAPARVWRRTVRDLIAFCAPPGSLRVLSRARVDLLPHQLEPALAIVRGACTRVLLADDVGLGKTIEAGLIIAGLRERAAAERVLVLTPAGLRDQWLTELNERFGLDAMIADQATLAAASASYVGQPNPWQTCGTAIASIDLAKRPEHLAGILECGWDVLVVDEAHNAAAETDRRATVEAIARRTPYVVLVTATPHNGDRDAFVSLCGIGAMGEPCAVFRRTRASVGLGGRTHVHVLQVTPTWAERRMHEALAAFTRAVRHEHGEIGGRAWLAAAVLNKRGLSSAHALWRSATRRLETITEPLGLAAAPLLPFDDPDGELDRRDDEPEYGAGPVLADGAREARLVAALARSSAEAARQGESKLEALARWLRRVDEPAIVFSEYRDTLRNVADALGRPSVQLHGGLTAAERRGVLAQFPSRVPILLATDAAGEGLNLHEHCRNVINLELPWNPVRLEQRIGRVDRIGQARTVHALVLVARHTPEERILDRLRSRLARARHDLMDGRSFDLTTERDVERLVLAGDDRDAPRFEMTGPALVWPALPGEAAAEVDRARLARTVVAVDRGNRPPLGCALARSRHRETRARLRGSTLALLEVTVEDGCGAVVERTLVPLAIGGDVALDNRALVAAVLECDAIDAFRAQAVSIAQTFVAARAVRERALARSAANTPPAPLQPGLFDLRAERAAAVLRAVAEAARDALARRGSIAEQAAAGCAAHVHVRVILRPAR